ncbi:hypothetical protein [Vibrio sp. WXL103]|uniref:hypothetical protein n=1 Tax=Vibrio sp. WXL103 TaxID=3450710 RepID=UPI003EC82A1D
MSTITATQREFDIANRLFAEFLAGMPEISINTAYADAPSEMNTNDPDEIAAYLTYAFEQYLAALPKPQPVFDIPPHIDQEILPSTQQLDSGAPHELSIDNQPPFHPPLQP